MDVWVTHSVFSDCDTLVRADTFKCLMPLIIIKTVNTQAGNHTYILETLIKSFIPSNSIVFYSICEQNILQMQIKII